MWTRQRTVLFVKRGGFLDQPSECWHIKITSASMKLQIRCYWTAEEPYCKNIARFEAMTAVLADDPCRLGCTDVCPGEQACIARPVTLRHISQNMYLCSYSFQHPVTCCPLWSVLSCLLFVSLYEIKITNRFISIIRTILYNISVSHSVVEIAPLNNLRMVQCIWCPSSIKLFSFAILGNSQDRN